MSRLELLHYTLETWFGRRCYICGATGVVHLHHLLERHETAPDSEARILSEVPEMTALLCPAHHAWAHNYPDLAREVIFQIMYRRPVIGYERIKAQYDKLAEITRLDWELPEYDR